MKRKALVFGDSSLKIAELNTAQVEELIDFGKQDRTTDDFKARTWRTIMLSINNAEQAPTKDNPLGSEEFPHSKEHIAPMLGFSSVTEVHNEILALTGLKAATPGELQTAQ